MKKYLLLPFILLSITVKAQLTGIKTIPGDYATITAAVTALNTGGVGAGGVTFNIAAGYTETGNNTITATGTAANPIIFQKSGAGANPTITAGTGTGIDAIIKLVGSDYITFDGLSLIENAGNNSLTKIEKTEYGFAFFKPTQDDGCQYNTIKNCTISLNKTYFESDPFWGSIYNAQAFYFMSGATTFTNLNTAPAATSITAGHSYNIIQNNIVNNCSAGFVLNSNRNTTTLDFLDHHNQILNNTITAGGHANSIAHISVYTAVNTTIDGNTLLCDATQTGAVTPINYGLHTKSGVTITNNTVQMNYNYSSIYSVSGIQITAGGIGVANSFSDLVLIKGNTVSGNIVYSYNGIYVLYVDNLRIESNTINLSTHPNCTGTGHGINVQSAFNTNPVQAISKNIIQGNVSSGNQVYGITASGVSISCLIDSNKILNNNAFEFTGIFSFAENATVTNNIIACGTANFVERFNGLQLASNGLLCMNNYIGCMAGSPSGNTIHYGINILGNVSATPRKIYNNTVYLSGGGAINNSTALVNNGVATAPTDLRNNIFVNNMNPGTTGKVFAFNNSATVAASGLYAKNNLFYAGIPGSKNAIYSNGSILTPNYIDSTLEFYKLRVCAKDINSVTENPPFLSLDYTNPNYLHINPAVASLVNDRGFATAEVTVDYDGDTRSATTPDIGADELNGIAGVLTTPLTPPVLWLKADAGVFTDAGVTAATNGQTVQQWNDQSCSGFNAAQPDASKRPTWQQSAFNGKPALWFDGTNGNYWLENTVNTPVATTGSARTYFVVAKAACSATGTYYPGGHLFTNRRTSCASTLEFVQNGGSGIFHGGNLCSNHPQATSVNFADGQNRPFIGSWRTNGTGTNLDFWFNGTAATTANANFIDDNGGAGYCVGDRRDGFQYDVPTGRYDWQGHIAEIIVYDRALTEGERQSVETYLQNKYNTTGLPAIFNNVPATTVSSNSNQADASWIHTHNSSDNSKVVVSIKSNCLDLGTINSTVYTDATAGIYNGQRYMRRHYVINPTTDPVGTKRVRLYYTNADFADLQTYIPALTNASQLVVTKFDGINEDGVYNPAEGTSVLIPSSQITTGTVFGINFLEFDVTGFSEFWIHTGLTALPLNFLSFSAQKCNTNQVCLTWKTANEQNVSHFEIERSADGINFTTIGTENAGSNNYYYKDRQPNWASKSLYYRIKQVDNDSRSKLSNIAWLKGDNGTVQVYPTLITNTFTVQNNTTQTMWLQLTDATGKTVLLQRLAIGTSVVSTDKLTKGVYFYAVKNTDGENISGCIIKQ